MSTPDVNIRKPSQWASCNAPHMWVCTGDVNTRKPLDKRVFFGLHRTPRPRACHTALCDGRRCPWVGPRGVNSGYGHPVPSGQRTPLVSHGVTVGCHRPTRWYNVITPNQRGFMNSSLHWASANKPPVFIISQHFGT